MILRLSITFFLTILWFSNSTVAQVSSSNEETYIPIQSGDMLWNIAMRVRPDPALTRYQVMAALFRANPQAFRLPCNMLSLRIGTSLRVPRLAEMQAIDSKDAFELYTQHSDAWKNARQQGQPLTCSGNQVAAPLVEIDSPPVKKSVPAEPKTVVKPPIPYSDFPKDYRAPPEIPSEQPGIIDILLGEFTNKVLEHLPPYLRTPLVGWGIAGVFLGFLLLVWWINYRAAKRLKKQRQWRPFTSRTVLPPHDVLRTLEDNESATPFPPAETQEVSPDLMNNHLTSVRTYLADGKEELIQKLLQDVLKNGTPSQQEEAKQLLKISEKIDMAQGSEKQSSTPANSETDKSWQELVQMGKQLPVQYLPEDRIRVFALIDKIFEMLDYELNAQGKLIDAYVNRHKQAFFESENYAVFKRNEKVVEQEAETTASLKATDGSKSTRFL